MVEIEGSQNQDHKEDGKGNGRGQQGQTIAGNSQDIQGQKRRNRPPLMAEKNNKQAGRDQPA